MKILVTGRAGSGKTTLAAELASRDLAAYDGDTYPNLAYWRNLATGQNLAKNFPVDYSVEKYGWYWDPAVMGRLLSSAADVILCGSADNMADFYPAFDKRFILNVEPWEQLHRLQNREHGYAKDDPELQRKIVEEQAQLVANASQIGATLLNAQLPIDALADKIIEQLHA
ncbi:hypothetical protein KC976_03280 [Candidatus Saccharibacteria bacterium]|nr:hypothetical protein [Candidatus Saccharibacteria bacterium]